MVKLFKSIDSHPPYLALANFHCEIIVITKAYRWQRGVLSLALDFHTQIVEGHPFDFSLWKIPAK